MFEQAKKFIQENLPEANNFAHKVEKDEKDPNVTYEFIEFGYNGKLHKFALRTIYDIPEENFLRGIEKIKSNE